MKIFDTLQKYNLKIKKNFGQNFLINKGILNLIAENSEISKDDTIVEIGPGLGFLTEILLKKAKKVISIEKDDTLIPVLKEKFIDFKNFHLENLDALKYDIKEKNYKIVANIPYYITSPLIRHFYSQKTMPKSVTILVQKEVADKICDTKKLSILSLEVLLYATPYKIKTVSKNSFFPAPKVNSEILLLKTLPKNQIPSQAETKKIMNIAKIIFSNKRKKLLKTLQKSLKLDEKTIQKIKTETKIKQDQRPEELKISDLKNLITHLP
ncbi:MAG: 16S rRNA (adenine(1518)-N(6)/adenine(1519)-N(6))-dimethyltransferase RsmA [Candidatus Gracilibacteria bacterium]|jgi:16S rRNA (adenine1518-N6/adenine1519-N6)-dimethyltransferase|nr:16S rRNA (adenine(1518)-N(6)/adenine(1519)-N(6))-dimethyltransferase RsmA [Candidatus Gracilibacteria bacterium]